MPCTAHGFRWPNTDTINSQPTGTVCLHERLPIAYTSGQAGTYSEMDPGAAFIALYRDPLRCAVVFTPNVATDQGNPAATPPVPPTYQSYAYDAVFSGKTSFALPSTMHTGSPIPIAVSYLKARNAWRPHGDYLYCGTARKNPSLDFVYLDKGASVHFSQTYVGSSTADLIGITKWDGGDCTELSPLTFSGGTANFVATQPCYLAFSFIPEAYTTTTNVRFYLIGSGDVFAHRSAPGAFEHYNQLQTYRTIGNSILWKDVANELNKNGSIFAGTINDGTPFWNHLTAANITPLGDSYTGKMVKGLYAFVKPTSQSDFNMKKCMEITDGVLTGSNYYLDSENGLSYSVVRGDVQFAGSNAASVAPGAVYLFVFASCYEYTTNDQWIEREFSEYSWSQGMDALEGISRVPAYHENPLHFSDLVAFGRTLAKFVTKHRATIAHGLNMAAHLAATVAAL